MKDPGLFKWALNATTGVLTRGRPRETGPQTTEEGDVTPAARRFPLLALKMGRQSGNARNTALEAGKGRRFSPRHSRGTAGLPTPGFPPSTAEFGLLISRTLRQWMF